MDFRAYILLVLLFFLLPTAPSGQDPILTLQPRPHYVSTPDGRVTFICQALPEGTITHLQWLMNGSSLEDLNLDNVTARFTECIGGILTFRNVPMEYNSTRITCAATITVNSTSRNVTRDSLLLVQGLLSGVDSLNVSVIDASTISLTWSPPFTLNISMVDPDIDGYCVDFTLQSIPTYSVCGINRTEFSYTISPDSGGCADFRFTITPVNIVGNGTSRTITYSPARNVPELIHGAVVGATENSSSHSLTYLLTMSAPVCDTSLMFIDVDTGMNTITIERGSGLLIVKENITFTSELLATNRHYNVVITASNVIGSITSYIEISTHDVVMVTAEMQEQAIVITALYSEHSTASGALFSFVFSGDVDFSRSFLLALDRNTSHNYTLPFDLYPGHYRVYVYDIEHDGMLLNGVGYPAVTGELFSKLDMTNNDEKSLYLLNCTLNSTLRLIWAECSHPESSFATGIQVIVQSTKVSEVHKLYVNQSMDLHTPVTVPVERDGEYQVSIFAIREGMGILEPTEQYNDNILIVGTTDVTSTITAAQGDVSTSSRQQSDLSSTEQSTSKPSGGNSIITLIAVGVVVAVLVATILVVMVILIVVCCISRRHKQQSPTLVELNMYCTTEELQEENEVPAAFTTLSPADVSAGYSVVTASAGDGPPLYADVVAFSAPQPHESVDVGEDEHAQEPPATYSSLSHSLKPKSCENGSGQYSLLNHPTNSKPAKASGFVRPDTSLYSSLGELSQTKKLLTITEDNSSKENEPPGTGETAGVYSLLNLSAREHPKASSAGDTEENLIPCYATVGGLVDKKVTTKGKQAAATKENIGKDGTGATTEQQDDHIYATVNLAAKKKRRLKQQSAATAENSSGEGTAEPDVEGSSGRGDSDMGLYDDARPNNQRSEGPSKENPDHESNSEDQQHQYSKVDLTKKKKRKVCHQAALSESHIANGDGPTIGEQGITGSDITSGAVTSCDVTSCDVTNFDIISEVEAGACCPQQPRALPQPPTGEEDHQIENNGVDNASPGEPDIVTTAAATENVRREAAKYCDVDLLEASTFSGPLNGSKVQYSTITGTRNKHDIPYEFVATSPPSVISPAGVLGDFNRVVYSDLRTDSSDTTARTTSHNAAHASPSHQDHVAEGGGSSGEKEGKPKYCEVTLLEDSTVKDVPILNGHGVEYSTVTGTQNKHSIHYAFVDPIPSSTEAPAPFGDTNKVVYSAVRPHVGGLGKSEERCNNDTTSATSAHSATNAHSYSVVDLSKKRNKKPKPATDNKSTAQD